MGKYFASRKFLWNDHVTVFFCLEMAISGFSLTKKIRFEIKVLALGVTNSFGGPRKLLYVLD